MAGHRPASTDPLAVMVRRHDPDRYIATLYAPRLSRPALWAVYAFAAELAQIPVNVSESALGEMRLEWWRAALEGLESGGRIGHPAADALGPVLQGNPGIMPWLQTMIDGRAADLYSDGFSDTVALEAYFGATLSLPIRVAAALLGPLADEQAVADAAGHGGVALGLGRMACHFSKVLKRRPELIPLDILSASGIDAAGLAAAAIGPESWSVLGGLVAAGQSHLEKATTAARVAGEEVLPALLPLAPLYGDLRLVAKRVEANRRPGPRGTLYRQWAMWRAMRRGAIA